jgi:Holliday junction DNA helicase RuvA
MVLEAYPNRLVVDVQGVGYEVIIPLSTYDHLHAAEGMVVDLRTHLHFGTANQPGQKLFGFATEEERDVFLMLIERVSGIGPSVLSGLPVSRFKSCVITGNTAELTRIKGLGKKTAERIVLELKDKVGVTDTWQDAAAGEVSASAADAELALLALGYKQVEARKALRKVLESDTNAPVEVLIRGALRVLQG